MYLREDSRVTQMTGGKGVDLSLWSVADPMFLELAGLWWNQLLPRVKPYMYENGGPVAMVQVTQARRPSPWLLPRHRPHWHVPRDCETVSFLGRQPVRPHQLNSGNENLYSGQRG